MDTTPPIYRTGDLSFATYLRIAGIPFMHAERDGRRVYFLFEDPGDNVIEDLRREYFADKAKVPVMSFVQMLRTMKTIIHNTP